MANPTTNFGWVMPVAADLVTNLPAQFDTFGQAVDTSMSELRGGAAGAILSKSSATQMDFTWGGLWTAYTPTFVNFTLGNGTITKSRYAQIAKTVIFDFKITMGTTSSMGTSMTISLPVTATNLNDGVATSGYTVAPSTFVLSWITNTTTTAQMAAFNVAGTYLTRSLSSSTVPHTWTSGSTFAGQVIYEAA